MMPGSVSIKILPATLTDLGGGKLISATQTRRLAVECL